MCTSKPMSTAHDCAASNPGSTLQSAVLLKVQHRHRWCVLRQDATLHFVTHFANYVLCLPVLAAAAAVAAASRSAASWSFKSQAASTAVTLYRIHSKKPRPTVAFHAMHKLLDLQAPHDNRLPPMERKNTAQIPLISKSTRPGRSLQTKCGMLRRKGKDV